MIPGLSLQKLTTREPSLDQLEVAITSLRAVMTAEQLAEVAARPARSDRAPDTAPGARRVLGSERRPAVSERQRASSGSSTSTSSRGPGTRTPSTS